ncbi:acyl-CoA dehydrogenase [Kitasatospora sp. NPDC057015]|uniref:acyl-CoA dehydrogenase family protein n=1 Tax=Kitasatospora sp. NPDC057015 TaxID=3346001 RepID=UPI00362C1EBE
MITSLGGPPAARSADTAGRGTTAELTRLLFGEDREEVHGRWRRLGTDPRFRPRHDASAAEQTEDSYRRLHLLNEGVDATALARDPYGLTALHEWTGPLDGALTVLMGIHYNLFLGSLVDHDPHPKRTLDEYAAMDRVGTFLCTELGHGNDAAALETVARYDPDDRTFTLHTPSAAAQKFMPNTGPAGGPKSAVVAARLLVGGADHGIFLFLVPLGDEAGPRPGVIVRPLPLRPGSPVDHCLTSFDELVLPQEALLGGDHGRLADDGTFHSALGSRRKRFLTSIGRVTLGKLCMSASALGVSRAALATAVRYGHHRQVAGARPGVRTPVWSHRSHHGPLVEALATTYAMNALHRTAVDRWAGHDRTDPADVADAQRLVAVTKGWTTWQARAVLTECRERCGAQGLLPVNGIVTATIDIEGTITAEGDNLALWAKAGAELLLAPDVDPAPDAAPAPHTAPARGVVPAPAGQGPGWEAGRGADSAAPSRRLGEPGFLQSLLRAAEDQYFARARTRMRTAPPGDSLRRWNAAVPFALTAVTVRAERLAGAALLDLAQQAADPAAAALLHDLHRLFALRRISAHTGPLLAAGRLDGGEVAALPDLVEQSIARLADHAGRLVDAFDLPEELLAARPIATPDYQQAFDDPDAHWHRAPVG